MRKGKVRQKTVSVAYLNFDIIAEKAYEIIGKRAKSQRECFDFLLNEKTFKIADLNSKFGYSSVKGLIEKGLILVREERIIRSPYTTLENKVNSFELNTLSLILRPNNLLFHESLYFLILAIVSFILT